MTDETLTGTGGRMQVPRTRGAVSGVALILLGAWGALAPFIGPYFDFAFTPQPGNAWHWTAARGWFEVLPGGVAVLGGLVLLFSANRAMTLLGAWIAIAAGGWFVVGLPVAPLLTLGDPGAPAADHIRKATLESLSFFTALGAVIVLFAALAAGRLSVRSVRDVRVAAQRDADAVLEPVAEPKAAAEPEAAAQAEPEPVAEPVPTAEPEPEPEPEPVAAQPVATSEHPDAPYAPDGHTPEADAPPTDATPQQGGPAYATPQRYVRPQTSQQIPVERLQRDHPSE